MVGHRNWPGAAPAHGVRPGSPQNLRSSACATVSAILGQAIAWTEVGFSSEDASSSKDPASSRVEAAQWSATGIGPAGSRAWCSAGFPPELAQQWLRHGVGDPRHALKWIDAGFDDVTASPWLHAGVAPDDAKGFDAHGVSAEDLRDIAADHRSLGHVQPWLDAGFSVVDFRRWHDGCFSYEHAVPWLRRPKFRASRRRYLAQP